MDTKKRIMELFVAGVSPLEISHTLAEEGVFLLPSDIIAVYNETRDAVIGDIDRRDRALSETITPIGLVDRVLGVIGKIESSDLSTRSATTVATLYRVVADLLKLHYHTQNEERKFEEEVERRVEAVLKEWEAKRDIIEEASKIGILERFVGLEND